MVADVSMPIDQLLIYPRRVLDVSKLFIDAPRETAAAYTAAEKAVQLVTGNIKTSDATNIANFVRSLVVTTLALSDNL